MVVATRGMRFLTTQLGATPDVGIRKGGFTHWSPKWVGFNQGSRHRPTISAGPLALVPRGSGL